MARELFTCGYQCTRVSAVAAATVGLASCAITLLNDEARRTAADTPVTAIIGATLVAFIAVVVNRRFAALAVAGAALLASSAFGARIARRIATNALK